ncbi:MAG: FAD:protein FMN transferase [Clostridia bacterium]|nr:FAD:protein FMN transferase [Clostridia bacterium]
MISVKTAVTDKLFVAMGTVMSVRAENCAEPAALDEVRARVTALHGKLSAFDDGSEISRVNRAAGEAPVPVSEDTFRLIARCVRYAGQTGGRFDITAGPAAMLWKRAINARTLPDESEIAAVREKTGFCDVLTVPDCFRVGLRKKGQSIDLGGVAKGFAADEAKRILAQFGVCDALLNFGGTVVALGRPKSVGVRDPFSETGRAFAAFEAENEAVVTSGVYEQGFEARGRCWHHIVDPITGEPADSPFASVTLIGQNAEMLDAFATAACILPARDAFRLIGEHDLGAVFVTRDRQVILTENVRDRIRFL